jgi:hypothetical protein
MPAGCPRIVIIGAGAAGVFTAYRIAEMYGDRYEIVLVERDAAIGGNASTKTLTFGGRKYSIDCGAQFFHRGAQASYVGLLADLGLFDDPPQVEAKATGITIWDKQASEHLLWIPSRARGFLRYRPADWDRLTGFATFLAYAFLLDRHEPNDWSLRVDTWCSRLKLLDNRFIDQVVRNFLYQFVTLPADRICEASALYAITHFVRNVFGEATVEEHDPDVADPRGVETFEVFQTLIGMDGVMKRALERAGVKPRLREAATAVHAHQGKLGVCTNKEIIPADHVVLATDPCVAAKLLETGKLPLASLVATLKKLEYSDLPIAMQKGGSCWMPGDDRYCEAINTIVDRDKLRFTAWFGPLRRAYKVGKKIPVYKSWGSPNIDPTLCNHTFYSHEHRIMMPTTDFMKHRAKVEDFQGQKNIWFVGGWTRWFDSQEAALDSATEVAERIPGAPFPGTGRITMVGVDRDAQRRRIDRWLHRVALRAPLDRRKKLRELMNEVEAKG